MYEKTFSVHNIVFVTPKVSSSIFFIVNYSMQLFRFSYLHKSKNRLLIKILYEIQHRIICMNNSGSQHQCSKIHMGTISHMLMSFSLLRVVVVSS